MSMLREQQWSDEARRSEEARLEQLRSLDLRHLRQDARLTRFLEAVAVVFRAPLVRIQLVEEDDQICAAGIGEGLPESVPREESVCTHTIDEGDELIIPDLAFSERFRHHPAYVQPPHIRFYAGATLRTPGDAAIGTLCVMDFVPRHFREADRQRLRALAPVAEAFVTGREQDTGAVAQDPGITGLLGREYLKRRLEAGLRAARDEEHAAPVSLVLLHLEDVASFCGAGQTERAEVLLHAMAERVAAVLPVQAEAGEWDSDELLIWAPATGEGCDPDTLAHTVSDAVRASTNIDGRSFRPTAAVCVLRAPDDAETLSELASMARRLTQRTSGDPRVRVARQLLGRVDLVYQVNLVQRLDEALEAGRIQPFFQPRVSLKSEAITGMEALARWHDEELGWISPGDFVPVAERTGRIVELGDAMLDATCTHLRDWLDRGLAPPPIAVNVSPEEFREPGFVARVRDHLARHEVPGSLLELEITERGFSGDLDTLASTMAELAGDGVRFAVDDFGTGYCSLVYLQRLPAQHVKIDRSFVTGLSPRTSSGGLVNAIVDLSRALAMSTIAEGVESMGEVESLRDRGVGYAQGFFYYFPMCAGEAERRLIAEDDPVRRSGGEFDGRAGASSTADQ